MQLRKALEQAFDIADMVVTSGGISTGTKDAMPQTIDSLGNPGIIF
jgi:molybdopterin biosynthesis enzyme